MASSGGFRAKLRVFVSKHFFSYRYDYREEWLRFTRMLVDRDFAAGVQERTIVALADLVESPGGALWVQAGTRFRQVARCSMSAVEVIEPDGGYRWPFLARTGWIVDLEGVRALAGALCTDLRCRTWLRRVRVPPGWSYRCSPAASWSASSYWPNPRAPAVEVNWEVLDLLKTASRQAAAFWATSPRPTRCSKSRKFDAFNRMSAFVVHDLKNLVAQLSLMLKNAERHRDNPEFQRDMLATVEHVVGRMYI